MGRSHGSVFLKYRLPTEEQVRYLHLEMGKGERYTDFDSREAFLSKLQSKRYPDPERGLHMQTVQEPTKRMMRTRRFLKIFGDPTFKESVTIDLEKGLLYVQGPSSEAVVGKQAGQVALNILHLLDAPDTVVELMVGEARVSLTNLQWLQVYLTVVRDHFKQPEDFVENVEYLLRNRQQYVDTFLLRGSQS